MGLINKFTTWRRRRHFIRAAASMFEEINTTLRDVHQQHAEALDKQQEQARPGEAWCGVGQRIAPMPRTLAEKVLAGDAKVMGISPTSGMLIVLERPEKAEAETTTEPKEPEPAPTMDPRERLIKVFRAQLDAGLISDIKRQDRFWEKENRRTSDAADAIQFGTQVAGGKRRTKVAGCAEDPSDRTTGVSTVNANMAEPAPPVPPTIRERIAAGEDQPMTATEATMLHEQEVETDRRRRTRASLERILRGRTFHATEAVGIIDMLLESVPGGASAVAEHAGHLQGMLEAGKALSDRARELDAKPTYAIGLDITGRHVTATCVKNHRDHPTHPLLEQVAMKRERVFEVEEEGWVPCEHGVGLAMECVSCPPHQRRMAGGRLIRTRVAEGAELRVPSEEAQVIDHEIARAARAAHEANRAYCDSIGDHSQVAWEDAPQWQRDSAISGVHGVIAGNTPEQSHESWLKHKTADGWVYGEAKDAVAKTHPCMVPYADLSEEQRAKDTLFVSTVRRSLGLPLACDTFVPDSYEGVTSCGHCGEADTSHTGILDHMEDDRTFDTAALTEGAWDRVIDDGGVPEPAEVAAVMNAGMCDPIELLGEVVWYRSDGRGGKSYDVPAIVAMVQKSHVDLPLLRAAEEQGYRAAFENNTYYDEVNGERRVDTHTTLGVVSFLNGILVGDNPLPIPHSGTVHLRVQTPGETTYRELSVPYDPTGATPRSWRHRPGTQPF